MILTASIKKRFVFLFLALVYNSIATAEFEEEILSEKENNGLFLFVAQPYISCSAWNKNNVLITLPCFRQFTFSPYFEYEVMPWLTFGIAAYFESFGQSGIERSFNIQNITPSFRFLLLERGWHALFFQVSYNQNFQSQYFYSETNLVPYVTPDEYFILKSASPSSTVTRADLEKSLDIRFIYSLNEFVNHPGQYNSWYANYEISFRHYFDGAADEIHFDCGFGLKTIYQKLIFDFQNLNTIGLRNPRNSFYPNYDLFTVMFDIMYDFNFYMRGQIGFEQDIFGRNTGMATYPFGAIMVRF